MIMGMIEEFFYDSGYVRENSITKQKVAQSNIPEVFVLDVNVE